MDELDYIEREAREAEEAWARRTFYFYLSRKQIVVVWQDAEGRHSRAYSKSEKGERSAMNKMNALISMGYTRTEPPRDWFSELIDSVKENAQ